MRGNIFHNPVSLLSFLLVTFKAKSFYIITNSSLPNALSLLQNPNTAGNKK